MILPSCEDPQNLSQSKNDQMMGKIECVIRSVIKWYGMRWNAMNGEMGVYLPQGLPNIDSVLLRPSLSSHIVQCISVIPVSPYTSGISVLCQAEWWWWWWETNFPATPLKWYFAVGVVLHSGKVIPLLFESCCSSDDWFHTALLSTILIGKTLLEVNSKIDCRAQL